MKVMLLPMATDVSAWWQGAGYSEDLLPTLDAQDQLYPMQEVHEEHWNEAYISAQYITNIIF